MLDLIFYTLIYFLAFKISPETEIYDNLSR